MKKTNTRNLIIPITLLVLALGLLPGHTFAEAAENVQIKPTLSFAPDTIRLSEITTLSMKAEVPKGYHFYSMTKIPEGPLVTEINVKEKALEPVGEWFGPKPHVDEDPNFKKHVEYYEGTVVYKRNFKLASAFDGGKVKVGFRGQICDDKQCIPTIETYTIALNVEDGEPRAERLEPPKLEGEAFPPDRPAPTGKEGKHVAPEDMKDAGFIAIIIIGFVAGLGALITPCVFPMIPITISFFSKFSKVSLKRSILMGGIYAGSIMLAFTAIGIIVSIVFGAAGMQNIVTNPFFNFFMVALLVVFAFNLFGLFEIRVPSWLVSKSSQKEMELTGDDGSLPHQALGVFFMGITFTLVTFTCTVGFIGVVLAAAAEGQVLSPTIGMLSFSFAFAMPFFFLAVFPNMAGKLQGKGGDWMVAVKVILGFIELAAAFKFLSNLDLQFEWGILSRSFVLVFWAGIFFLCGMYLLRVFALPHNDTEAKTIGPIRMFFALLCLGLAFHSGYGATHSKSVGGWMDAMLPPIHLPYLEYDDSGDHGDGGNDILTKFMHDDIPGAMAKGREQGKPVFIDFTGYNCTNCRYMESNMFPKTEVRQRLEKMILVSAYTDGRKDVHTTQREHQIKEFGVATLPYYIIVNPFNEEITKTTALSIHPDMTESEEQYIAFLDKGLAGFEAVKPKDDGGEKAEGHGDTAEEHPPVNIELKEEGELVDFEFPDLKTGKKFKLSSMRGSWVFVNLWASWCGPCKKELKEDFPPALKTAPHIKMLNIAFDGDDTKDAAIKFADEINLWQYVTLQGGEDAEEAGMQEIFEVSNSLPISYLIHPKGHIAWMQKASIHKELLIELFKKVPKPEAAAEAAAE